MGEPSTKSALIESAIKMFQQKGFQMTRVSDIVSAAGVAQGTFYNYFKSKDSIFREICNDFTNQLKMLFVERTEHMFDGNTANEVVQSVHTVIRDAFVVYRENLAVAEILFREGIGNGGLFKEIYEGTQAIFLDLIEEQVGKAKNKGFIHFEDAKIASVFLFGLFERSLLYFMIIQQNTDMEKLERVMVDFILKGLSFDFNAQPVS
jgi:AcrR family transcriptional regulator